MIEDRTEIEKEYFSYIKTERIQELPNGYFIENGRLYFDNPTDLLKPSWNKETKKWEESATNLEIVQAQYNEYEGMDTPSTLEEMKQQDPALAEEYLNMMIELRELIYTLSASEPQPVGYSAIHIPQPSEALKNFKNKFKKV